MRRWLAAILAALVLATSVATGRAAALTGRQEGWRVLWVPLDSRPVNTQEAVLLGEAAGAQMVLPPAALLDWHAERRADGDRLLTWWRQAARKGDTVVFATNSLLLGGLIASRDPEAYAGLEGRLAGLERSLRQLPRGRRIALHVLPRAWPTQFGPDHAFTRELLERTELQHRLFLFGKAEDRSRLAGLERRIPAGARSRQDALIRWNQQILRTLMDWAAQGLVDEVMIGLDDARPFGMTNLLHRQMEGELRERGLTGRVHAHYGADELGFLVLAREALQRSGMKLGAAVEYDQPSASNLVLPYEGVSLGRSIEQKLELLGAAPGQTLRLFLYSAPGASTRGRLAAQAAKAYRQGEVVALADVSTTGQRNRGLVEQVGSQVPLRAVAYGGWNTASNAAGTALALAAVQVLHRQVGASERQRSALQGFQVVRYAHDLIFQAQREPLAAWARRQGIDPTRFGPGRKVMADHLRATVLPEASRWLHRFYGGGVGLADLAFPWDRTFEVSFRPVVVATPPPAEASK